MKTQNTPDPAPGMSTAEITDKNGCEKSSISHMNNTKGHLRKLQFCIGKIWFYWHLCVFGFQKWSFRRCPKHYRLLPDEAAINTIETRCFRVSRLADLKDCFEWKFGFDGYPPELEESIQKRLDDLVERAGETMGILCFSKEIKDPILWSHHADGHKGIAFEVNVGINVNLVSNLHKVEYDKPRIVLPYRQMTDQEWLKRMENFYKQKSKSWGYEQEYRLVIDHAHAACKQSGGRFFWKIPAGFITRVIIGFHSSISEQYLRQVLDLNGFQNVQIVKAKQSLKTYDVEVPETQT
jgi:hypothetical protein